MDHVLLWLLFAIAMPIYFAGVFIIRHALKTLGKPDGGITPDVTVIIAARNERENIGACLDSLKIQDYPEDRHSVIVVDDRSDDGTGDVVRGRMSSWRGLSLLRIEETPSGVSPKKHALMTALAEVKTDIVLQTDADCVVPRSWVSGMARHFKDGVGFVAGLSPYSSRPGMLNAFIRHEYLWNAGLLAGTIALGSGVHATGRNMGFRRSAFDAAGGYGESLMVASGDDTLLMQRILHLTSYTVAVAASADTHVPTDAPRMFGEFMRQRLRHMSTGRFFGVGRLLAGAAVYGLHLLLLLSPVIVVWAPSTLCPVMTALLLKLAADFLAARAIKKHLYLDVQWGGFIVNELLLLAYMALMPLCGAVISVKWKENS